MQHSAKKEKSDLKYNQCRAVVKKIIAENNKEISKLEKLKKKAIRKFDKNVHKYYKLVGSSMKEAQSFFEKQQKLLADGSKWEKMDNYNYKHGNDDNGVSFWLDNTTPRPFARCWSRHYYVVFGRMYHGKNNYKFDCPWLDYVKDHRRESRKLMKNQLQRKEEYKLIRSYGIDFIFSGYLSFLNTSGVMFDVISVQKTVKT